MMFNKSTTTSFLFFLFFTLFLGATAAPTLLQSRDVFTPPVLAPNSTSVWAMGSNQTVVWNITNRPANITNTKGSIILSKGGILMLDTPLASGFDILLGQINVTVPSDIDPGSDYQIIVFGDSGNHGDNFTIINAE